MALARAAATVSLALCVDTHTNVYISLRLYHATLGVIQTISRENGVPGSETSVCEFVRVHMCERNACACVLACVCLHVSSLSSVSAS